MPVTQSEGHLTRPCPRCPWWCRDSGLLVRRWINETVGRQADHRFTFRMASCCAPLITCWCDLCWLDWTIGYCLTDGGLAFCRPSARGCLADLHLCKTRSYLSENSTSPKPTQTSVLCGISALPRSVVPLLLCQSAVSALTSPPLRSRSVRVSTAVSRPRPRRRRTTAAAAAGPRASILSWPSPQVSDGGRNGQWSPSPPPRARDPL